MASKRRRPLKKAKASIDKLSKDSASIPKPTTAGQEAIDRVQKCFDRARHQNANEQEAKAATLLAMRTMEKYQISQADLMINEVNNQRAQRGGLSTVDIRPHQGGGRAFTPGWVDWLVGAIQNFFDCRCFSKRRTKGSDDRIEWTFYGIAEHTVSAAIAFEAIHNQIQDWAEPYVGIQHRNSYCLGVAHGLLELSRDEKKASMAKAREAEKKALAAKIRDEEAKEQERQAMLFRVSIESESENENEMDLDDNAETSANDTDGSSEAETGAHEKADCEDTSMDDASDNEVLPDFTEDENATTVDAGANFETQLLKISAPSQPRDQGSLNLLPQQQCSNGLSIENTSSGMSNKQLSRRANDEGEGAEEETVQWKSRHQLTTYRKMSEQIAADVIKERKIKIRKKKKRLRVVRVMDAFKQGEADSKDINIRAARIEKGREVQHRARER
ncbi:MAG: hypothetical protein LQ344_003200 [Seirophora lacunosa]|nr:MAG: hypothetical protein LQ344_003200 [Seirophora lacunosa]